MPWDDNLLPGQKAAAAHTGNHTRLLAGPGTGKTLTLTRRICYLISECDTSADCIVVLTFTRAAARELRQRISKELGEDQSPRISTLHSFALRQLLRNVTRSADLPKPLRIADDWEERNIVMEDLKTLLELETIKDVSDLLDELSADWQSLTAEEADWEKRFPDPRFLGAWREHRQIYGYTLRAELVYQLKKILEQRGDFELEGSIAFLLVDEYQDLNRCDLAVVQQIVELGSELFIAGDDDQSIYGFRKAHPEGIRRFPEDYPDAAELELEICKRCDRSILELGLFVARQDPRRIEKAIRPESDSNEGEVALLNFADQNAEAKGISDLCKHLIRRNELKPSDILILLRSDRYGKFSHPIREELERAEIPVVSAEESLEALEGPSGKALLGFLRLAVRNEDSLAWRTLLQVWCDGIGEKAIGALYDTARGRGESFAQTIMSAHVDEHILPSRHRSRVTKAIQEILNRQHDLFPEDCSIEYESSDKLMAVVRYAVNSIVEDEETQNIILLRMEHIAETLGTTSLGELVRAIELENEDIEQELDEDRVNILTMHRAKGLTAEAVIVAAAEDQYLPGRAQGDEHDDERRLLYVSLTRAKHHLYVTYCDERTGQQIHTGRDSGSYHRTLSRFLESCPVPPQNGWQFVHSLAGENPTMIPRSCKRLAEVDFPIAEVSKHAVREKSIRQGHPSTLHLWWARRPLASSRAMLLALLLPDPCDKYCPEEFKKEAREILLGMHGCPSGWTATVESDKGLRRILLRFIADFANWDLSTNQAHLSVSQALVKAAHGEDSPLVVDPFSGGGSIPLEALRLGCEAFASDLNPVACLILKVMLDFVPRYGSQLATDMHQAGSDISKHAHEELADLYPSDSQGTTPIAYLWARTVNCEAPGCGAEIPLLRSFWLCRKDKRKLAIKHRVKRIGKERPIVLFEIFEPNTDREVRTGNIYRAKATCLCCGAVLPPERVRSQLVAQRGGADPVFDEAGRRIGGARMTAVVSTSQGQTDRQYRLPTDADYAAVHKSFKRLEDILKDWEIKGKQELCPFPDEPTPKGGGSGAGRAFSVQRYGMQNWGDLFTARQKLSLVCFAKQINTLQPKLAPILALALSRFADDFSSLVRWMDRETPAPTFTLPTLSFKWDFCETNPFDTSSWSWEGSINWVGSTTFLGRYLRIGMLEQADATIHPLPDKTCSVWFTDPPYYDAIPYADLSDFFLVWLKRTLPSHVLLRDPFDPANSLTPKLSEAVQDETKLVNGRPKDRKWFEETMALAFAEGRRVLKDDGIGSVVFAHKTTDGWEALLSGMIRGGWTITGSWPIATERPGRPRSQDSAALATSVHLVCRPRQENAPIGDWVDVLNELPRRVAAWMDRLQDEGILGADLVFACVGPALEVFSRHRVVETAEGQAVELQEYLEKVWEVVGRTALEQVLEAKDTAVDHGLAGALEEDARLTALFLWTLQNTYINDENDREQTENEAAIAKIAAKGFSLPFDIVRRFAQPMGIDLSTWDGRVINQEKGLIRLLPVMERAGGLFGEEGAGAAADWIESNPGESVQPTLFPELEITPKAKNRRNAARRILDGNIKNNHPDATTLDRVHAAMLLQANGFSSALRKLIGTEQDRGPEFLRLANALSALYPRGSQEKRLLDAMLLVVPR